MLVLSLGALLCGSAFAQIHSSLPEWQPMKIEQNVEPVFPVGLLNRGLTNGVAQVAISVDRSGQLVEWLVLKHTQPEFSDAAVTAIKRWKFEPARLQGEAVNATAELVFNFEAHGVVVSTSTVGESVEGRIARMTGGACAYQYCSARDLDRVPMPTVTVRPQYPKVLADQGVKGQVTVEYYIDETGSVRMPSVSAEDNTILGALAVAAVSEWKFTPPTSRGKNVLVKASQVFDFRGGVN
jgi:TonB family protein